VAGGKVVQAHYSLLQLEQGFEQVAADKAGHTGDKPGFGGVGQVGEQLVVCSHVCSVYC
jgi:hypothetical protein